MPTLIDAVRAYATEGEIIDTLADVFGRYVEVPRLVSARCKVRAPMSGQGLSGVRCRVPAVGVGRAPTTAPSS